jgi:hypothetical protein
MGARERLLRLAGLSGPFFFGSCLSAVFGFNTGTLRQTLHRWAREGLIIPLGARADVYLNTYHPDHAVATEAAVLALHPSALVIGHQVLYEAGVTSQLPATIDMVTIKRGPTLFGYRIHVLPVAKHAELARQLQSIEGGKIPRVAPRAAFEAARSRGVLALDDDDIEWDALQPTKRRRAQ